MITHYFGLPRCGKSTWAAMLAARELRRIEEGTSRFRYVLTNFYIEGCYQHSFLEFGSYDFHDCYIIIDESMIDVDNRDWKSFTKPMLISIVLHGHFNADLVFFSQDPKGLDRKIQTCREELYWLRKFGQLTCAIKIPLKIKFDEEGNVQYGYVAPGIVEFLTAKWCFRPRYYHLHDSYWTPDLPRKEFIKW